MREFVVIQAGGWFCQFNCTQIIYGCLKKFTRHNPDQGNFPTDSNMVVSHNHSYSFPSTTASTVNCFNHTMKSQPALLPIVPTIGPLHISLNSKEHVVSQFFSSFHQEATLIANKPKPWRISLILELAYGGWTLIQKTVIPEFFKFKDIEYAGTTAKHHWCGLTCVLTGENTCNNVMISCTCADEMEIQNLAVRGMETAEFEHIIEKMKFLLQRHHHKYFLMFLYVSLKHSIIQSTSTLYQTSPPSQSTQAIHE